MKCSIGGRNIYRSWIFALTMGGVGLAGLGVLAQRFDTPEPEKYRLNATPPEPANAATPSPDQPSIKSHTDPETAALDPSLGLDTRRYLLYLYARLNKPRMAEALAGRILNDNPSDQQTLQVLASMYTERKEIGKALKTAQTLIHYYPNDDQSWYFLGSAFYLAGRFLESEEIFQKLKARQFKGRLYPYETDLASAALKAGDWYKAMLAYQELLRHHQLSEPLRLEARQVLEGIYHSHLPQLSVDGRETLLKSGLLYRSGVEYRQHATDRHMLFFRGSRSDVKVDERPDLKERWTDNHDAVIGVDSLWNRLWQTSAWAGGGEAGPVGGAKLIRYLGEQRTLEVEVNGGERATDGLLMESLNGRQHRVSLNAKWLFTPSWLGYFQIYGREAIIAEQKIGRGYGITANLEHVFTHELPDFRIGYRLTWMEFSNQTGDINLVNEAAPVGAADAQKALLLENLVLTSLHRQGLYLSFRDQLSGLLSYQTTVGFDYSVDRSSFEYYALTGLRYYLRKSLELRGEAGYNSSARTADQDSDQWQVAAGLTFWF